MSFVSKAASKIFKGTKKVVKAIGHAFENKWVRYVGLAALAVFATGLGSTGFSGFSTAMQQGGGGMQGFFSAVGSTMATGFSTIGSAFTQQTGTPMAEEFYEGGESFVGPASSLANNYVTNAAAQQGGTNLATRMFGGLFANTPGASMMRNAMLGGMAFIGQRNGGGYGGGGGNLRARANIYGGRARKGTPELRDDFIRRPTTSLVSNDQPAPSSGRGTQGTPSATMAQPLLGKATQIDELPGVRPLLAGAV